jgi:hypothetical protein
MIVTDGEKEDMASKAQIFRELKKMTEEVQQLLETNILKIDTLPEDQPTQENWTSLMYLKGYSDALQDVADRFAALVERLKNAEEE